MVPISIPDYVDLLGAPFERGARGPDKFDCYGLIIELHRRAGVELPDFDSPGTVEEIAQIVDRETVGRWKRVPLHTIGAVLTFRVDGVGAHVGMLIERGRFLHAVEDLGVTTARVNHAGFYPLAAYVYE